MNRSAIAILSVLLISVCMLGCGKKQPAQTAPEPPPTDAPTSISLDVEAMVPTIVSLTHGGTGDLGPGDRVRLQAAVVAPDDHSVRVVLENPDGRDMTQALTSTGGGRFGADVVVPNIDSGSYRLLAQLLDGSGNVVASRYADTALVVGIGPDACRDMGQRVAALMLRFDFDKSEITESAKPVLGQVIEELRSLRGSPFSLEIQGHCDNRGTVEYNLALGEVRARTVREYMASVLGSDVEGEMRIISYGEERPLIEEDNEKAWATNRRAQFVLTCPGG